MKKKYIIIIVLSFVLIIPSLPQIFYKNKGVSESVGKVNDGKLINGYKLPFRGDNFKYFSAVDYYLFGRCYVHSKIHKIVIESYKNMINYYPDYRFRIMECSKRKGGRSFPHRTHQNGTSIDFMTPLKKGDKVVKRYDKIGMWRYLMKFDSNGKKRINKKIEI